MLPKGLVDWLLSTKCPPCVRWPTSTKKSFTYKTFLRCKLYRERLKKHRSGEMAVSKSIMTLIQYLTLFLTHNNNYLKWSLFPYQVVFPVSVRMLYVMKIFIIILQGRATTSLTHTRDKKAKNVKSQTLSQEALWLSCEATWSLYTPPCQMKRGGLMVRALVSWSRSPGSSPGRGHCVVFLDKTLGTLGTCGTGEFNAGGNPTMD